MGLQNGTLMLQEGGRVGSCLTLRNELSEATHTDKARDFIGKGNQGRAQEGKGTQENYSATWLTVSSFMMMGLVSGLSLMDHSNSRSFLVMHTSLNQDGFHQGGFWEVVGHMESSFDLSQILLISGDLLVLFLTRTSCHKITYANGHYGAWPGWVVSISISPNA